MSIFVRMADAIINIIGPPDDIKAVYVPAKRVREDLDVPNIFVGKIMDDGNIKCEVVAHNNKNNMHVKILEIKWERLGTYFDVGKIYPVFMHSNGILGEGMQIWEISSKRMKRDTSQVLLCWEKDIGWSWDLDF